MPDSQSQVEMLCSLCNGPLTLLPSDTTTDERGLPMHPECYMKQIAARNPEQRTAA
jgi:hypothetical protein